MYFPFYLADKFIYKFFNDVNLFCFVLYINISDKGTKRMIQKFHIGRLKIEHRRYFLLSLLEISE